MARQLRSAKEFAARLLHGTTPKGACLYIYRDDLLHTCADLCEVPFVARKLLGFGQKDTS